MSLRRVAAVAATTLSVLAVSLPFGAPRAGARPVACDGMPTPDGRIFPEPLTSLTYLTFSEFECGIALVEEAFPDLVEITTIGTSVGGHPIYDVVMTDETIGGDKPELLVMSSIHGDEIGAREGAARIIEEMAAPDLLGGEDWVQQVLDEFRIHFSFPNPDGWVNGEIVTSDGASVMYTRENDPHDEDDPLGLDLLGQDLNRNFPVKGYFAYQDPDYFQPEGEAMAALFEAHDDWYLGTDNHGQANDEYLAAGLQIVGEFDYQKSEELARFADGISAGMGEYVSTQLFAQLEQEAGEYAGAYHWGTLYDILGYSASGSGIDYYNTPGVINGSGFATELTVGKQAGTNQFTHNPVLNQIWVDSIRAINYTMFRQAIDPQEFVFETGGDVAYLFDPKRIRHDDANGVGNDLGDPGQFGQAPYDVSRMKFFEDLDDHADRPVTAVRIGEVLDGTVDLDRFDTLIVANDALPEGIDDEEAWWSQLGDWVDGGGNLLLTDAALQALPNLVEGIAADHIQVTESYVGSVETFTDRGHPLNAGLRGVASQTFDTVPIGYAFGGSNNSAPNWEVDQAAWEAAGGFTAGTHSDGFAIHGELPVGDGRIGILGALLPDPTEEFYHPFGLQNYAVTYTGYTLLHNHLQWDNPAQVDAPAPAGGDDDQPAPVADDDVSTPTTGGGSLVGGLLAAGALLGRRPIRRRWPSGGLRRL